MLLCITLSILRLTNLRCFLPYVLAVRMQKSPIHSTVEIRQTKISVLIKFQYFFSGCQGNKAMVLKNHKTSTISRIYSSANSPWANVIMCGWTMCISNICRHFYDNMLCSSLPLVLVSSVSVSARLSLHPVHWTWLLRTRFSLVSILNLLTILHWAIIHMYPAHIRHCSSAGLVPLFSAAHFSSVLLSHHLILHI